MVLNEDKNISDKPKTFVRIAVRHSKKFNGGFIQMKKRILALSLAAAMLVGAMASCSAKEEVVSSEAVVARDISLVLWGSEQDQDFLKEVSAEWATKYAAEHEDVKSVAVDVQIKGEDAATTDALNDITAAADVFGIANNQLSALNASNAIYKMPDSIVEQIKAVVGDSALGTTLFDGGYYGFPYAPNTANILFYNKSVYTEDEVKTLEGMLAKENVAPIIAPLTSAWDSMTWFASAGCTHFAGGDKTDITLNSDEAVKMIVWLKEQIDAKKIVNVGSNTDAAAMLKDGSASALFYQDWSKDNFKDALGDNFGVVELPSLNGSHMKCFGGSKLLVLNANTKEPEAALDLAQYITNEDNQLKRFEMVGQCPTAPALATNEKIAADPVVAADVAQGAYTINNDPLNDNAISGYWNLEAAVMTDLVAGNLADEAAIKGALDKLVADLKANIESAQ